MSENRAITPFFRRPRRLELLLVTPVLLLLAGHAATWGAYLWLGKRVQAAAEAGLTAAGAGARLADQEQLARIAAARLLPGDDAALASRVVLQRTEERLMVQVSYDASSWPIYQLRYVLPTPPRTVVKVAKTPV